MKIEVVQTRTLFQTVGSPECKDCEEEARLKEQQEQELLGGDNVTLSGQSPLQKDIGPESSSGDGSQESLESEGDKGGSGAGVRPEAELSQEEKQVLDELKARDREVRSHEQAHLAAAGPYAKGPPSFEYQTGPDGKRYAVGGEVAIDTSKVPGNPQATLVKAQTIKQAATAPKNPSTQDRQVAAQASRMEAEARREIQEERSESLEQTGKSRTENSISPTSSTEASDPASGVSQTATAFSASEGSKDSSAGKARIQNTLQQFFTDSIPEKGSLLDTVS